VAAIREGTGGGPALWAYHHSTAEGHAIVADHGTPDGDGNSISTGGNAISATRDGGGDGDAIVGERKGAGDGYGVLGLRSGDGDGVAIAGINSSTVDGPEAGWFRREGAAGNAVSAGRVGDKGGSALNGTREDSGDGYGVYGIRLGDGPGAGVRAEGTIGLVVAGRSQFSSVGAGTVASGSDSAQVNDGAMISASHVTVALTGDPGVAALAWIERGEGAFTVHLTAAVVSDTPFSYFIVEPFVV
jgi:hypothetical protein